ncbi:Abi family protein [Alcanivorax jadensis]|uniref:Abi family protein n=1 Tax=Alcanivorax jadensis TaxID=64988 RepID=UPI003566163F
MKYTKKGARVQVDQAFIAAIEERISKARLDSYRGYFSCSDDAEVVGAYLWNKSLATAFYPLLQAIEVTLRNAIHHSATAHFSGNREWFLMRRFPQKNNKAKWFYKKKNGDSINPRPDPDTVVSRLTFGYWVELLTAGYDDPVDNNLLWPTLIPAVFPNANGVMATRRSLHKRFKFIKDFRNRVGHHEPLWKIKDTINGAGNIERSGPTNPDESIARLNEYIGLMLDALRWMSDERYQFVRGTGLVEQVEQLCSIEALHSFQRKGPASGKFNKLYKKMSERGALKGAISGVYSLKTSKKGQFLGEDVILDVRHIRPPKF